MTTYSSTSHKRENDDADPGKPPGKMPRVSATGKILVITAAGEAASSEIRLHESVIGRGSPKFQALIKEHKTLDKVSLPELEGNTKLFNNGAAALDKYVHFMYTSEIIVDEHEADDAEPNMIADLGALIQEWLFGLFLQDARYCNAIMDKLIKVSNDRHDLLYEGATAFSESTEGERSTPLWKWLVERLGGTLSKDDLDYLDDQPDEEVSKLFFVDLLRRVLKQSEGEKYRRAPTFAARKTYHLKQENIGIVWEVYANE